MPQQPESRSVTRAPGMRSRSAFAGPTRPSDFWWQWPWRRISSGPGWSASEALPSARRPFRWSSNRTQAAATSRACRCASPRSRAGDVVDESRQAARLEQHDGHSGRGQRMEPADHVRGPVARRLQEALRDEGPPATGVRSEGHPDKARRFQNVRRGEADVGVVVIGERVGEQDGVRSGRSVAGCSLPVAVRGRPVAGRERSVASRDCSIAGGARRGVSARSATPARRERVPRRRTPLRRSQPRLPRASAAPTQAASGAGRCRRAISFSHRTQLAFRATD